MGELERFFTYALVSLFSHLQKEVGWSKAIFVTLSIALGLGIAGVVLRLALEIAKHLIKKWPRGSSETKGMVTLGVLSTLAMLLAALEMPYSFYMLLRVLVCLTSLVALAKARRMHLELWQWVFGVIAALYNPFLPVHLGDKELWTLFNIATVVTFWVGEYKIASALVRGRCTLEDQEQVWVLKNPREGNRV